MIILAGLIWFVEAPGLRRKKQKRELTMFYLLLFLGTATGVVKALDWPLPNPLDWVAFVFQPAADALAYLLGG